MSSRFTLNKIKKDKIICAQMKMSFNPIQIFTSIYWIRLLFEKNIVEIKSKFISVSDVDIISVLKTHSVSVIAVHAVAYLLRWCLGFPPPPPSKKKNYLKT